MPVTTAIVMLFLLIAAPTGASAQPEWWRDGGPRIRSTDSRASALVQAGVARSATVRRLVERVEAADVVVYVGMLPTMGNEQAGGLQFVGDAGTFRYLRITINPSMAADMSIATLGHELQHVIEVIDHPEVRDEASLVNLYRRIGAPSRILRGFGWETQQAQAVGNDVRRELATNAAADVSASFVSRPRR